MISTQVLKFIENEVNARTTGILGHKLQSRVHFSRKSPHIWFKRDDELSFGISGSKLRKLAALLFHWKAQGVEKIIALGGMRSNHVVSALQVFNELGFEYEVWVFDSHTRGSEGSNEHYIQLLAKPGSIKVFPRSEMASLFYKAEDYASTLRLKTVVMPEGGCQSEALWGGMSLGLDILRNMREQEVTFDEIFIDSGTGISAVGLKMFLDYIHFKGTLNVVQMAPAAFDEMEQSARDYFKQFNIKISDFSTWKFILPHSAKSFGSVNKSLFDEIKNIARDEGIITDPIYSAKLFQTALAQCTPSFLDGKKVLIVHSGGGLALSGFWHRLHWD